MKVPVGTKGLFADVDQDDYASVNAFRWNEMRVGVLVYAARRDKLRKLVLMHRQIMAPKDGQLVDHVDGNGLNNTRGNLRLCSHAENMRNRKRGKNNKSGFKGVSLRAKRKDRKKDDLKAPWVAEIRANGKRISLGYYKTPELAHAAYCAAAKELHGDFARFA